MLLNSRTKRKQTKHWTKNRARHAARAAAEVVSVATLKGMWPRETTAEVIEQRDYLQQMNAVYMLRAHALPTPVT